MTAVNVVKVFPEKGTFKWNCFWSQKTILRWCCHRTAAVVPGSRVKRAKWNERITVMRQAFEWLYHHAIINWMRFHSMYRLRNIKGNGCVCVCVLRLPYSAPLDHHQILQETWARDAKWENETRIWNLIQCNIGIHNGFWFLGYGANRQQKL